MRKTCTRLLSFGRANHGAGDAIRLAITQVEHFQQMGIPLDAGTLAVLPGAEVVLWAQQLHGPLTAEALKDRFNVHRATAYRWKVLLDPVHNAAAALRAPAPVEGVQHDGCQLDGSQKSPAIPYQIHRIGGPA